jgi:ABC-type branched-subunit amino acid transport system ATPase component
LVADARSGRVGINRDSSLLLAVDSLSVHYGGVHAVSEVCLAVASGERVGIIGPNGAGKTTLINAIAGDVKTAGGTVELEGRDILGKSAWEIARLGLGRTFQTSELFQSMSVLENFVISAPQERGLMRRVTGVGARARRRAVNRRAEEVMALVGLSGMRDEAVGLLPYGRQRIAELGRALMGSPRLLLLDEPAAGLSSGEKAEFVAVLRRIIDIEPFAVLMIEHDMETLRSLCGDHIYVMDAGRVIAEGTFDVVTRDERVITAYLGREKVSHSHNGNGPS